MNPWISLSIDIHIFKYIYIYIYRYIYTYLESFDDPCFGWNSGLVLGGKDLQK